MDDAIFTELMAALDLVVIERLPNGYLTVHGRVPAWFDSVVPGVTRSGPVPFEQAGPFLHNFLEEAGRFWWDNTAGRLKSGPCAATDRLGQEFHFEATALTMGQRRLLLVERLADFADTQHVLQIARERALADEKAAVRQQSLGKHAEKLLSLVQSLDASGLSAQQADLLQRIKREGEGLQKVLGQK